MVIVAAAPLAVKTAVVLRAERARAMASIHAAVCRYRAQALVCSTCENLDERAARLARVAGAAS